MKVCHFCSENNKDDAIKCVYCQSVLSDTALHELTSGISSDRLAQGRSDRSSSSTYALNSGLVKLAKLIAVSLVVLGFVGLIYLTFKLMGVASERSSVKRTIGAVDVNVGQVNSDTSNSVIAFDGAEHKLERRPVKKETIWSKVENAFGGVKDDTNDLANSAGSSSTAESDNLTKLSNTTNTTNTTNSINPTTLPSPSHSANPNDSPQSVNKSIAGNAEVGAAVVSKITPKLSEYLVTHGKLWRSGSTINIAFIEGSLAQRAAIESTAVEWSRYANLKFDFDSSVLNSHIRISFQLGEGNWSYIGTDAKNAESSVATMNFDPSLELSFSSTVVLQQFGRAIGLLEEQHNPYANIPWDREAVHQAFGDAPKRWSAELIDQFLMLRWPENSFPSGKPYDSDSIMHERISGKLTLGNIEIEGGVKISVGDKEWVRVLYP